MLTVNLKERERLIWEHDVKMDLREVRCEVVVWIHVARDVLWLMRLYHDYTISMDMIKWHYIFNGIIRISTAYSK